MYINRECKNYPGTPGAFGGSMCVCPKCIHARSVEAEKELQRTLDKMDPTSSQFTKTIPKSVEKPWSDSGLQYQIDEQILENLAKALAHCNKDDVNREIQNLKHRINGRCFCAARCETECICGAWGGIWDNKCDK